MAVPGLCEHRASDANAGCRLRMGSRCAWRLRSRRVRRAIWMAECQHLRVRWEARYPPARRRSSRRRCGTSVAV